MAADNKPLRPEVINAWRLCIDAANIQLGEFNWPWALGLALDEIDRLRQFQQSLGYIPYEGETAVNIPQDKISDEAVEAAAVALAEAACVPHYDGRDMSRAALAAAVPYIEAGLRQRIAAEIEARKPQLHDPNIEVQRLNAFERAVLNTAARVARGTQETSNG